MRPWQPTLPYVAQPDGRVTAEFGQSYARPSVRFCWEMLGP